MKENNYKKSRKEDTLCIEKTYIERKNLLSSFFSSKEYTPLTLTQIFAELQISKKDKKAAVELLDQLVKENAISKDEKGRYVKKQAPLTCRYQAKTDQFGFAICEQNSEEDVYIPDIYRNTAMDGDTVLVSLQQKFAKGNHRRVGKVTKIVKRKIETVIGTMYEVNKMKYLQPIDPKCPSVQLQEAKDISSRDLIEVCITEYPTRNTNLKGKVLRIISSIDSKDAYVKALYYSYGLDQKEFSEALLKEIENIPSELSKQDYVDRVDKTKENIYTIDSEDAKDLDDAICVKKKQDGSYELSVHIADVSNYVKQGTLLDNEAVARATSIYIPGTVIPMLPKKLSNGICSLNEGQARVTLSVDMQINATGKVVFSNIYKGIIVSKKKMTYEKVQHCLNHSNPMVEKEYAPYLTDIGYMKELADLLRVKRFNEGSINFNLSETKVVLSDNGELLDIKPYDKNEACNIIEEFMLITNKVVAEKFSTLNLPFIYRIHETPDEQKLRALNEVLIGYGKKLTNPAHVTSKEIADILENFQDESEKKIISTIALRTLKLAKYNNECLGHFGLGFSYYCHFTSPIRRYPDLFIHRVISEFLAGTLENRKISMLKKQSILYSTISTEMEGTATKIERDFDDLYCAMYMQDKIGQVYEGIVASVTSFGMFVQLENTVEGLIHISKLPGNYIFDEKKYRLVSAEKTYCIGDKLKVVLEHVDVKLKQVDFCLEEEPNGKSGIRKKAKDTKKSFNKKQK